VNISLFSSIDWIDGLTEKKMGETSRCKSVNCQVDRLFTPYRNTFSIYNILKFFIHGNRYLIDDSVDMKIDEMIKTYSSLIKTSETMNGYSFIYIT